MLHIALVLVIIGCLWAITDKRVPTGILATIGLALIISGCLAAFDDEAYLARAFEIRTYGFVLMLAGGFWRYTGRALWNNWWISHEIDAAVAPPGDTAPVSKRFGSK